MQAKVSWPIIVIGPVYNGVDMHPAIITRVYDDNDTADQPTVVNAAMFPDGGGESQYMPNVRVCQTEKEARSIYGPFRTAFWAL